MLDRWLALLVLPVIVGVLALLTLFFLLRFLVPALILGYRLSKVQRRLKAAKTDKAGNVAQVFSLDRHLAHAWKEYEDTLHRQTRVNPATGVEEVASLRSTVPAEMYFSADVLIDSRLHSAFFRHLPGIFTGIGIIGTFYGLIKGLAKFQSEIAKTPGNAATALPPLLEAVGEAFVVSAVAITLAMLVTFVEKLVISSLYRQVEALGQTLDSMFESGAGEEYLSRLVRASEESASQTAILKDSLVGELKAILTDLTERQIAAQHASSNHVATSVTGTLQQGLKEPLDRIATAVNGFGQTREDNVARMVADVLTAFTARVEQLFGGQMTGIQQMQQQTVAALQGAVGRLNDLTASLETAGRRSTEVMGEQLTQAMTAMEDAAAHTQRADDRICRADSRCGRRNAPGFNGAVAAELEAVGTQVRTVIEALQRQSTESALASEQRSVQAMKQARQVSDQLDAKLAEVLAGVAASNAEMRTAVEAMRATTADAVSKFNAGAETLFVASSDFAKAGTAVSGTLDKASTLSEQLGATAAEVQGLSASLGGLVSDYKATRDAMQAVLDALDRTVENAKREASLTADVVQRIEAAARALGNAEGDVEKYLEQVSQVLADAHNEFAQGMQRTLNASNTAFYEQLSKATGLAPRSHRGT